MKLLVVDGNSIVNRAFYGIRPLTTKDGVFTNAVYGFMTMLEKMKTDVNPDAVAIAFDLKAPTFRHQAYALYKANRKGMPEELAMQMPLLKELLGYLGYPIVTCEGYEADDILGTLSRVCAEEGSDCVIATGDRDSLQLIGDHISVRLCKNMNGTTLYTPETVKEEYGVDPKSLIEVKAIQGDSSDNIPGVAGIGPKGATELIQKYGTVDYIYDHIDELDIRPNMKKKLVDSKDNAYLSRMLGEINLNAPVDTDLSHYEMKEPDREKAARLMARLELFSLIKKFDLEAVETPKEAEHQQSAELQIVPCDSVDEILKEETICLYCSLIENKFEEAYISSKKYLHEISSEELLLQILRSGKPILTDNSKPLFAYADEKGFDINIGFDISLAAYLLSPSSSSYDLERLCAEYGVSVPQSENITLSCAYSMPALIEKLSAKIEAFEQHHLFYDIEIPLARVLARMENIGFAVDVEGIRDYGEKLSVQIEELKNEIYDAVGYEFNINSPKQLGKALFEDLGLPAKKKTKSGYSTNAEVLEELSRYHPVVSLILRYRTVAKLKSTYCDSLVEKVASDGRIHSSFNQTETRTGRISSTEPNLQNIPVRTELGRELRRFFKAKDGCVLVDADYSQIELRVLAHIAGDENMKKAFTDNVDIHTLTASQVFNMPVEMVTPLMRSRAKAVNFGIVYGIGAFSLSKDIGVTVREAKEYIESYLAHFPKIDAYMQAVIEKAKRDGYVETIEGRRRYLPELTASNFNTRAFGERVARNAPIQGTAADIIKIAMVKVDERLRREGLSARLILQVHDELIVEAPVYEMMQVAMLLQEEMESAVSLSVPLVAEAAMGETWYDAKS
ncbi:MAG: DNA polymerase I [Ruminococcus sp.]|nr:DNA polymerase I [Ruminococcus sp.]